jgi:integrase
MITSDAVRLADHRSGRAIQPGFGGARPHTRGQDGTTPVLEGKEWRRLIDAIPTDTVRDLRDRALIATLTYGFARIGAALKMRVEDLQSKGSGWLIRLHEKGGKQHMMPCHHALAEALHAYIAAAGIATDKKAFLFRTSRGHGGVARAIGGASPFSFARFVIRAACWTRRSRRPC